MKIEIKYELDRGEWFYMVYKTTFLFFTKFVGGYNTPEFAKERVCEIRGVVFDEDYGVNKTI